VGAAEPEGVVEVAVDAFGVVASLVGVGINLITAKDPESRRRLLMILVMVNGLNSVLAIPAGLSRRTTALIVASNGVVAAVAALPALRSRPSRL
jgi:hypothetical protein